MQEDARKSFGEIRQKWQLSRDLNSRICIKKLYLSDMEDEKSSHAKN
jgi:hypothetical protein